MKLSIKLFWFCLCFIIAPSSLADIHQDLSQLELRYHGRIGVAAINTATNERFNYRAQERFPMGCTSKVIGVAAILNRCASDPTFLQEKIHYTQKDLVFWSPITQQHLSDGMTIAQLCSAAISFSDNTAMNLLTQKLGGVTVINAYARLIGDHAFRLDHTWPAESLSGPEGNDSSTPAAMTHSMQVLMLSNALRSNERVMLTTWLRDSVTGKERIRAGVPHGWLVGDKTGTGSLYGTTNDTAIIWPPGQKPIFLTVYFTTANKDAAKQNEVVAAATRIVLKNLHLGS